MYKLKNKYSCQYDTNDELGKLIKNELDDLFQKENFDEWQLIDIDKKIKDKYQEFQSQGEKGSTTKAVGGS